MTEYTEENRIPIQIGSKGNSKRKGLQTNEELLGRQMT